MSDTETDAQAKRDAKRERRKARQEAERKAAAQAKLRGRITTGIVIVVIVGVLGGLTLLLTGDTDTTLGVASPEVTSDGGSLPLIPEGEEDPAVGTPAPTIVGAEPDGTEITVGAGAGTPQVLAFNAHWCPFCQQELPQVAGWVDDGALADGVELVGVSTRHDPARGNWPPDEWFEEAAWPGRVLVDGDDTAWEAYGMTATPGWVFLDGDGTVVQRISGAIGPEDLQTVSAQLN